MDNPFNGYEASASDTGSDGNRMTLRTSAFRVAVGQTNVIVDLLCV
jgi:hypothetical protein